MRPGRVRRAWPALVLAVTALAAAGCREDPPAAEAARRGPLEEASAPIRDAPPGALAACPCLVEVATTEMAETPGGVTITVRARDQRAVEEIRARARLLAQGVGAIGDAPDPCPVVSQRTSVLLQEIPGGMNLLVFPREADDLEWLRAETRSRFQGLVALHMTPPR